MYRGIIAGVQFKKATSTETPEPLISATALRRLRQLSLLAGALGSTYLVIAMSTYSAQDPAFSHTGAGPVERSGTCRGLAGGCCVSGVRRHGRSRVSSLFSALKMGGKARRYARTLRGRAEPVVGIDRDSARGAGNEAVAFPPGGYIGLLSAEALSAEIGPAGTWILWPSAFWARRRSCSV